jgi:hypothetical protein
VLLSEKYRLFYGCEFLSNVAFCPNTIGTLAELLAEIEKVEEKQEVLCTIAHPNTVPKIHFMYSQK